MRVQGTKKKKVVYVESWAKINNLFIFGTFNAVELQVIKTYWTKDMLINR